MLVCICAATWWCRHGSLPRESYVHCQLTIGRDIWKFKREYNYVIQPNQNLHRRMGMEKLSRLVL